MSIITSFRHILSFLSPKAWIGIYTALSQQTPDFVPLSDILRAWLLHVFTPFLLLGLALSHKSSQMTMGTCFKRAAMATSISPMTIFHLTDTISPATSIMKRLNAWKEYRVEADHEALECLSDGISNGFTVRTSRFDVYFPKKQLKSNPQDAMIFLPGALVDHTSYSSIASRIADEGNLVVVVLSLEPLRLAGESLVEMNDLKRAMRCVTKLWHRRYGCNERELEWAIGGHSFGGYGAMRLAPKAAKFLGKSSQNKLKLVVWAAGNKPQFTTDLSVYDDISALILLGSNDAICNLNNTTEKETLTSNLPTKSAFHSIEGGTHNNFASYSGPAMFNGIPGIPRIKQHEEVSSNTIKFLQC